MATYIALGRYTQQGIQNIREGPARTKAAQKNAQALEIEFKAFYIVMGQYDFVTIVDAPDDETAAKFALATASEGNVRIETLRAFTEDEYGEIVASLP